MINTKPELLAPAGTLEKLKFALHFGADAVYAGVPYFSLRARENDFSYENLKQGSELAHSMGKKIYFTLNVFARNRKIKPLTEQLKDLVDLKPDALIMGDPGLILMVKEKYPEVPIHLSVQANCMNWQTVRFWQKAGVERIILSRELSLDEIREIKLKVPDMELETFIHGAICIAFSGRCLMSSYFSYRDANQGVCDNSCREKYHVHKADKESHDSDYFLEDLRQKGLFYQISEDENGTFLMNAKDLRLIEHLKELKEAGICSFKVEGRTKSLYYVGMTTRTYRRAIDEMMDGKEFNPNLLTELEKIPNRGYHKGFIMGDNNHADQNYDTSIARHHSQRFGGIFLEDNSDDLQAIDVRGKMINGQKCEVLTSHDSFSAQIESLFDKNKNKVDTLNPGIGIGFVKLNRKVPPKSLLSLID